MVPTSTTIKVVIPFHLCDELEFTVLQPITWIQNKIYLDTKLCYMFELNYEIYVDTKLLYMFLV